MKWPCTHCIMTDNVFHCRLISSQIKGFAIVRWINLPLTLTMTLIYSCRIYHTSTVYFHIIAHLDLLAALLTFLEKPRAVGLYRKQTAAFRLRQQRSIYGCYSIGACFIFRLILTLHEGLPVLAHIAGSILWFACLARTAAWSTARARPRPCKPIGPLCWWLRQSTFSSAHK